MDNFHLMLEMLAAYDERYRLLPLKMTTFGPP